MSAIQYPYLGKLGAMTRLPMPTGAIEVTPTLSEAAHTLISGATAVRKTLNTKTAWTIPYEYLPAADVDVILGIYRGLYGAGPFRFIDPTIRNVLPMDASATGARTTAALGWSASAAAAGTIAADTTLTTPVAGAGVLTWTAPPANAYIQAAGFPNFPGTNLTAADQAIAPPYIYGEAHSGSLYVRASSSVAMTFQLAGYNSLGQFFVSKSTAFTATTAWQRVSASVGAGLYFDVSLNLLPRLQLGATVPTSVSIAAAQVEYSDTPTAWQPGFGAPRVVITGTPGRTVNVLGYSDHSLTLAEAG